MQGEILGGQLNNYQKLKARMQPGDGERLETMWRNATKATKNSLRLLDYDRVESDIFLLEQDIDFALTPDLIKSLKRNPTFLELIAYLIYKPEDRFFSSLNRDPQWQKFPLNWAMHLPTSDLKILLQKYKNGEEIADYFVERYNSGGLEGLIKAVSDPIIRTPFRSQKDGIATAVKQAFASYSSQHYMACVYTLLPVLEGLLWLYSRYADRTGDEQVYVPNTNHSQLTLTDGTQTTGDISIGILLRNTAFGKQFNQEFIRYFCDELYADRNPVLHGRNFNIDSAVEAAKKIATLEYLFQHMEAEVQQAIISLYDKSFPPEFVDEWLENLDHSE